MKRTISFALLSLLILPALTVGPAAGGRRDQSPPPQEMEPRQQESTRIEIPEGSQDERADESTDDALELRILDEPAWILFYHAGLASLQEEVSVTMGRGYVPAAMEVQEDGAVAILYRYAPQSSSRRWLVEDFTAQTFNQEMTNRIRSGWDPVAITSNDSVFLVLFLQRRHNITSWMMYESDVDPEEMVEALTLYQQDNYALVDISIDTETDRVWYLFVREPERIAGPGARFFVNAYPLGEATPQGIDQDFRAARGFPVALASGSAVSIAIFASEVR